MDKRNAQAPEAPPAGTAESSMADPADSAASVDLDGEIPEGTVAPDIYGVLGYCISLLATEAWHQLGLLADPQTGETVIDLAQAKVAIDAVGDLAARLESLRRNPLPLAAPRPENAAERPAAQLRRAARRVRRAIKIRLSCPFVDIIEIPARRSTEPRPGHSVFEGNRGHHAHDSKQSSAAVFIPAPAHRRLGRPSRAGISVHATVAGAGAAGRSVNARQAAARRPVTAPPRRLWQDFIDQYEAFTGVLCAAAKSGCDPHEESEYAQLRRWFVANYYRLAARLRPALDAEFGGDGRRAHRPSRITPVSSERSILWRPCFCLLTQRSPGQTPAT